MKIRQLIDSIQKRPKMYVEEEKIEYIYYLLSGYCGANNKLSEDDIDKKFCCWFGKWLSIWIRTNIDNEYEVQTMYWYEDIKKISNNKQNETELFFYLCNIFFEDYKNKTGYFSWRKHA